MSRARRLTPETKTLRYMINGQGMIAAIVARRIRRLSFDLWGFVDVLGFKPRFLCGHEAQGAGAAAMLHVQATSSDHQANRMAKILDDPALRARAFAVIASGHDVEVWGWIRGRHAGAEAFHRFELRGTSKSGLVWHDRGIVEVDAELLVQTPR